MHKTHLKCTGVGGQYFLLKVESSVVIGIDVHALITF